MSGDLYRLDKQEAALIQWWRRLADEAGMGTHLACRLRAIAADPTPVALAELPVIAMGVEQYERLADELFQDARVVDQRARTVAELAKLTEPQS